MFEGILNFFKGLRKTETENKKTNSKDTAKERLHLVLMQDRANVSADFLELMKQEIIDVIKKYIEVDESSIDVRLTNKNGEDGENGAPALYANIPILNIRNDMKKIDPSTGNAENKDDETEIKEEKESNDIAETEKVEENITEDKPNTETETEKETSEEECEKTEENDIENKEGENA